MSPPSASGPTSASPYLVPVTSTMSKFNDEQTPEPSGPTPKKGIMSYIWDPDYHLKTPEERRLVWKLDAAILSTITVGYFMKYIDQQNVSAAYVSGMREDLKMLANQQVAYTFAQSLYNAALCICTIPGALIATKMRPSIFLAICELGWLAFTFAQAACKTVPQLYAFRFMIGALEAPFAAVAVVLMANWYTPKECGKRIGLWYAAGQIGGATSSFLQARIFATLDGHLGIPGWRWLYIVCGIMTFPSAVLIFFILPDYPQNCRVWFISEKEREMAKKRASNIKPFTGKINATLAKYIFSSWRVWFIIPIYVIFANSVQDVQYFAVWLRSTGKPTVLRNNLAACRSLMGLVTSFGYTFISDAIGSRWKVCVGGMILSMVPLGILAIYPQGVTIKIAAFFFADLAFITPVLFTWFNEICHENGEERAFMAGATNAMFYMVNSWLPILIFPQTDGPRFKVGFATTWGFCIATIPLLFVLRYMHVRQKRQEQARNDQFGEVVDSHVNTHVSEDDVEKKPSAVPPPAGALVMSELTLP